MMKYLPEKPNSDTQTPQRALGFTAQMFAEDIYHEIYEPATLPSWETASMTARPTARFEGGLGIDVEIHAKNTMAPENDWAAENLKGWWTRFCDESGMLTRQRNHQRCSSC
jgi:hypothetical protein